LRVQGADRDDRPGQVSERFQQFPDGRDLIGLRVTATWPGTAPIPRARAATRCGAFSSLFRAPADGLAAGRDHQPAAGLASFVADDGERESFHRSARAPPATLRPAGHITAVTTPQVTA